MMYPVEGDAEEKISWMGERVAPGKAVLETIGDLRELSGQVDAANAGSDPVSLAIL